MMYRTNNASMKVQKPTGASSLFDSSNDNYEVVEEVDPENMIDQYSTITNTMNKSYNAYSDYNKKVKTYYANNNLTSDPDIIDKKILDANFDNW